MSDAQPPGPPPEPATPVAAERRVREVARIVRGRRASDGAGVRLTRVIGGAELPDLDPFLLFDEFGSEEPSDYLAGFPNHPHRGFETVTYMLAGRMRHRDDQGNTGLLTPGSVQWMTAGRGIVHSEMPEQERGRMRGFQLWVNLPARDKMTTPRYQDILPSRVPEIEPSPGVRVRLLAGTLGDVTGPVSGVATEPVYLDVRFDAGTRFEMKLPLAHNAFCYVYEGAASIGAEDRAHMLTQGELGVLGPGTHFAAFTTQDTLLSETARVRLPPLAGAPDPARGAKLLLVAGRPLGEPIVRYGPFVMNTREEILQALRDFGG